MFRSSSLSCVLIAIGCDEPYVRPDRGAFPRKRTGGVLYRSTQSVGCGDVVIVMTTLHIPKCPNPSICVLVWTCRREKLRLPRVACDRKTLPTDVNAWRGRVHGSMTVIASRSRQIPFLSAKASAWNGSLNIYYALVCRNCHTTFM
jgi:hypothetical protein